MLLNYYVSGIFWNGEDNSDPPQLTPKMKDRPGRAHNRVGQVALNQTIGGKGDIATLGRALGAYSAGSSSRKASRGGVVQLRLERDKQGPRRLSRMGRRKVRGAVTRQRQLALSVVRLTEQRVS